MSIKKLGYTGSNKIIKNIISAINDLIDGGGGGGSSVSYSQTLTSGTKTGEITIDGVATNMYAPTPPDELTDLTDIAVSSPSNNDVLKYNATSHKWENGQSGGGNVDDVKVNGSSVVDSNKIAQIVSYKEVTRAQYEALPASKLSDGVLYCIKDQTPSMSGRAEGYIPVIYSDQEREIGIWRDGKPLYQRTYAVTYGTSDSKIQLDFSPEVLMFVPGGTYNKQNSTGNMVSYGFYVSSTDRLQIYYQSNSNSLLVQSVDSYITGTGYVTIRYTKTTDTPGSGIWNGQGGIAHHYSTDETIIGTWHDGKPLYEKTIIFDTGVITSNIDYDITSEMPANCEVVNDSFVMTFTFEGYDYRNVNTNGGYHQDNTSHYFNFSIGSARYNKHVELTIQYTKTTD